MNPVEQEGLHVLTILGGTVFGWCAIQPVFAWGICKLFLWMELPLPGHAFSPLDIADFALVPSVADIDEAKRQAKQELMDTLYSVFVLTASTERRIEGFIER